MKLISEKIEQAEEKNYKILDKYIRGSAAFAAHRIMPPILITRNK